MKMYKATSLDDIARQFRENAGKSIEAMNRSINRGTRDMNSGQAMAWNAAATMLENMEIISDATQN